MKASKAGKAGKAMNAGGPSYFTEDRSAETVIARMEGCTDARLKQIMSALIRHVHAAVKEVEPTDAEWMAAIEFLTETGHLCSQWRQEFILLSDTLGISMLVDAINHRKPSGATESTVLGPFHVADAPHRALGDTIALDGKGQPLHISGRVLDERGQPIAGATLDTWESNPDGFYDVQQRGIQPEHNLRGVFTTGPDGHFRFRTVMPTSYPIPHDGPVGKMLLSLGRHPYRPAHVHFIVKAAGFQPLTTHLFVPGDPYLASDAVFAVKESLIGAFVQHDDAAQAKKLDLANPFWTLERDFVLVKQPA
jgi:catechol 1,2-dioxygenase